MPNGLACVLCRLARSCASEKSGREREREETGYDERLTDRTRVELPEERKRQRDLKRERERERETSERDRARERERDAAENAHIVLRSYASTHTSRVWQFNPRDFTQQPVGIDVCHSLAPLVVESF